MLMLVMMSRFFFPLLWIDSRQQVPMENLSKLVKGQGRVHQKANRGEPTYLFTKEAGWSPCKQKYSAKVAFCVFRLCKIGLENPTITTLPSRKICSFIFLTGICRGTQCPFLAGFWPFYSSFYRQTKYILQKMSPDIFSWSQGGSKHLIPTFWRVPTAYSIDKSKSQESVE